MPGVKPPAIWGFRNVLTGSGPTSEPRTWPGASPTSSTPARREELTNGRSRGRHGSWRKERANDVTSARSRGGAEGGAWPGSGWAGAARGRACTPLSGLMAGLTTEGSHHEWGGRVAAAAAPAVAGRHGRWPGTRGQGRQVCRVDPLYPLGWQ